MKTPVLPYSLCKLFKGSELFTVTDEYLSVIVDFISILVIEAKLCSDLIHQ